MTKEERADLVIALRALSIHDVQEVLHEAGIRELRPNADVWCYQEIGDTDWQGWVDSEAACVEEGREVCDADFYVCRGEFVDKAELFDAQRVVDSALEAARKIEPDVEFDHSDDDVRELQRVLCIWADERVIGAVWRRTGEPKRIPNAREK